MNPAITKPEICVSCGSHLVKVRTETRIGSDCPKCGNEYEWTIHGLALTGPMRTGIAAPRWRQRWWLRPEPPLTVYSNQPLAGWELRVPRWAIVLDLLHRLIFRQPKLGIVHE